jgi:hypothetical protein
MSEWWTYRPSDFLMFSPRTMRACSSSVPRLQLVARWRCCFCWPGVGLGLRCCGGGARRCGTGLAALGVVWIFVAWTFHAAALSCAINWAATWFALAFAFQAVLMLALAWLSASGPARRSPTGFALLIGAVTLMPVLGVACGRRWQEAEVFGLTPDATVLGTLGFLLVQVHGGRSRALAAWPWLIPLMWCGVGGATLFALELPWAGLLPLAGLAAVIAGLARRY